MASQFRDESSATVAMSGSSAGSFEFGSGSPSASSCTPTIDGTVLASGGVIGPSRVTPAANDRTSGAVSLTFWGTLGDIVTISTGKSVYAIVAVTNNLASLGAQVEVNAQSVGSFTLLNFDPNDNLTAYYAFI